MRVAREIAWAAILAGLAPSARASAQEAGVPNEVIEAVTFDFRNALEMWRDGRLGGLLFYHDGGGPLGERLADLLARRVEVYARPVKWRAPVVRCASDSRCSAALQICFTGEKFSQVRTYLLVHEPHAFWGLFSEEVASARSARRIAGAGSRFKCPG